MVLTFNQMFVLKQSVCVLLQQNSQVFGLNIILCARYAGIIS